MIVFAIGYDVECFSVSSSSHINAFTVMMCCKPRASVNLPLRMVCSGMPIA
jgi:hypothetical protein